MAEDEPSTSNVGAPLRRAFTIDDSHLRNRRQSANLAEGVTRRRSSNFSDLSLAEARKAFQESTDDLLLPKPSGSGHESSDSSAWHSAPLAFALLPAIGGLLFKNGSSVITDVMLLGLAAIFLNWSVRLPWDWYHSAQSVRKREEYNSDSILSEESEEENPLSFSQTSLEEVPEDAEPAKEPKKSKAAAARLPAHEAATNELYTHEVLALFSCFLFPLLGAYLLHTIRAQLSRPSEGLVSDYNLTIFILASELRPMAHLVKLIQARTLHLQRMVNSNPYEVSNEQAAANTKDLIERLETLETRTPTTDSRPTDSALTSKQTSALITEVRKTLGPDIEALNRATRRYEKRATLQAFQTDSKLQELEARLNDAISLAAAAANNGKRPHGFTGIIVEWVATAVVLPVQAISTIAHLPFKTLTALIGFGRKKVTGQGSSSSGGKSATNSRSSSHARTGNGDRFQGRVVKR